VSRKRRSVKRKASRKVSRKRRSVKRKASRKVSRKRRSVKRKASRKRKSAKRKASRKKKSAKRKASRKKKSAKRKASRKKTRNSPPSGVIKKQNLGVGSVMVGQDGKTMYKVVEITMRGKPVKKWAKMKFKMGVMCSKNDQYDAAECDLLVSDEEQQRIVKEIRGQISRIFSLMESIEKNEETLEQLRKKETHTKKDKADIIKLDNMISQLKTTLDKARDKESVMLTANAGSLNQTRMGRLEETVENYMARHAARVAKRKARAATRRDRDTTAAKRKARAAKR
jgi:hypothetical protein